MHHVMHYVMHYVMHHGMHHVMPPARAKQPRPGSPLARLPFVLCVALLLSTFGFPLHAASFAAASGSPAVRRRVLSMANAALCSRLAKVDICSSSANAALCSHLAKSAAAWPKLTSDSELARPKRPAVWRRGPSGRMCGGVTRPKPAREPHCGLPRSKSTALYTHRRRRPSAEPCRSGAGARGVCSTVRGSRWRPSCCRASRTCRSSSTRRGALSLTLSLTLVRA